MIVVGVDPGTTQSAVVMFNGKPGIVHMEILSNEDMRERLATSQFSGDKAVLVIEQVESFGMAVGKEVFETVFWSGRFAEAWHPRRFDRLPRRIIKQHICHTARATDSNIRQALLDRFGGAQAAIGKKSTPGPLYGLKSHLWAAFAVAVTWHDLHSGEDPIRPGINAEF